MRSRWIRAAALAILHRALRSPGGVLAIATLAGCAAPPPNPDALAIRPEPGRALVVGWGNSAKENVGAALTPGQGTRVSALYVARANDKKIPLGENIARLAPGEYDLLVACTLYIGYRDFSDDKIIHAGLAGDRVYRLRAQPEGRRCQAYLEESKDGGK